MSTKFSSREDEILIDLVKNQPALYDSTHISYKDVTAKIHIWRSIAKELGKTEIDCKARWKNIRDYYKRKRNEAVKEKGKRSYRMESDFFQKNKHLSFLEHTSLLYIKAECSVSDDEDCIEVGDQSEENVSNAEDNAEESLFFETTSKATTELIQNPRSAERKRNIQETQEPNVKKKRPPNERNMEEKFCKSRVKKTHFTKELLQTTQSRQDPAISMFFQSIAATVSKFTPQLQAKAKVAVMNIVAKLELDNISQHNPSTSSGVGFTSNRSVFNRTSSSADSCSASSEVSNSYSRSPFNSSATFE